ncbi:anti-sigma factor [Flavisphingomonas formosensis]|uniref:anti-sigma factor n=1 Tax=Flavisphingomonas formosensis TaxID=861534 RepID=UPI0012FBC303|nr:anti-sigma factor [Sphingomonas formosensis]
MIDDETLFAWLDGELPQEEAARIEAAVAADPALARKAEAHRALRGRLAAAFDPIAGQPVPERLLRAVRPPAEVVDLDAVRAARAAQTPGPPRKAGWMAAAAALLVGLCTGYLAHSSSTGLTAERGGALIAAAPVAHALDTQLASAGAAAGPVQIGLTFRDAGGAVCRSFAAPAASGVACHGAQGWLVRALFARPEQKDGSYRMAGSADPALLAYVDSIIAGDPMDAAAEASAKAAGWRGAGS